MKSTDSFGRNTPSASPSSGGNMPRSPRCEDEGSLCGGIDESGLIKNFKRQGMDMFQVGTEMIDNSADAHATRVQWTQTEKNIGFSDDGDGMNEEQLRDLIMLNHHNDSGIPTKGIAGVGYKTASAYMSNYGGGDALMLTRTEDGRYLKLNVPWTAIFEEGVFSNMSKIGDMTEEDINTYKMYLPPGATHGTVNIFPKDDEKFEDIKRQFDITRFSGDDYIIRK